MSPRIAYWTRSFQPSMEAVASEVASLRREFPGSSAWGVSVRDARLVRFKHGMCFHPRCFLAFRAMTAVMQWRYDVNHAFGSLGDWHHFVSIRKRPAVLTVCLAGGGEAGWLRCFDRFAVEWPGAKDELVASGVKAEAVATVFPPVDLRRFGNAGEPAGQFTVLFASSPDSAEWLGPRGVLLLLDAAARCPEMRFRLLWRPWGNSLAAVRREVAERGLSNVEIVHERFSDMAEQMRRAAVVVAPFVDMAHCKPAPNSILEGLACGRPAVVTRGVGIAELIEESQAGVVCEAEAKSLAGALRETRQHWRGMSARARELAERTFGQERFIDTYRTIYRRLIEAN